MSMSKGTSHYNRKTWEDSNFPILCNTCLGDNKFVRMMVDKHGAECKICCRPFTTYRWNPGAKMRYKKTEVCQTCSRAKNVCQTCLLDLVYGLPVQVRDEVLSIQQNLPKDETNREYYNQVLDAEVAQSDQSEGYGPYKANAANEILTKLARRDPYYKRNRAQICSFWVKGECKRGEECPYRHDKPTDPDDPLSDQNMKDRYYGASDPVAEKMLKRISEMPRPIPPEDKSVTTIYVGNVTDKIAETDLKDHFYQFGEIRSINIVPKSTCAFVTFTTRESTEMAIDRSFNKLTIKGQRLVIRWGRSQSKRGPGVDSEGEKRIKLAPVPGLPVGTPDYFNLGSSGSISAGGSSKPATSTGPSFAIPSLPTPFMMAPGTSRASPSASATSTSSGIHYPSQDPSRLGSTSSIKLSSYNNRE